MPEKVPIGFTGELHTDNPLVGHFWSVRENRFVSWKEVLQQASGSHWLLLGENHDILDHQKIEDIFIRVLDRSERLGVVAFEQFSEEQQPLIAPWLGRGDEVSGGELGWEPNAWDWSKYMYPVSSALNSASQVLALDPSGERVRQAYNNSEQVSELPVAYQALMSDLIRKSHCDLLPEKSITPMVGVQQSKDRFMADVLQSSVTTDKTSIAIMGAQHARKDYGVPLWLSDDIKTTSIVLQQVTADTDPASYLKSEYDGRMAADYIMFTPGNEAPDYCEQLKGSLSHH